MEVYFWNNSKICAPPINSYKDTENEFDLSKITTTLEDAVCVLENQQVLHKEAAVLSRLIYKLGTKFRHDIGFSYLRRTNVALLKYLNLQLLKDINTFLEVITNVIQNYFPTRQMFEFILVRLQTFSKIMSRIHVCSKKAASFYFDRIRRGDAWWLSFMPYSVLCRIWYLSNHLLKNACKWYDNLILYRNNFQILGVTFVPEGYEFPVDLYKWLEIDEFDDDNPLLKLPESEIQEIISPNVLNNEEVICKKGNQINSHMPSAKYQSKQQLVSVGEAISRDQYLEEHKCNLSISSDNDGNAKPEIAPVIKLANVNKENKLNHSVRHTIEAVQNAKSLKQFISVEENYRKNNNINSLTLHLGFMQWHSLKIIMSGLISKINDKNNKKIISKIKKAWENKCINLK
ncbi:uncharacterized protein LOC143911011 [Arctopsyche grandis]|uniref:uncharacterized protein LOC143911011 n=1 Tax=Arctopsyche grandis TaxID=121162 RepID=UPI00406D9C12